MKALSKEQILGSKDLKQERVPVPEWGGEVIVSQITAADRDRFETSVYVGEGAARKSNTENLRARLCSLCLVDEEGNRLFTDADAEALGKKNAEVMDKLFDIAQTINGMNRKDVDLAKKDSAPTSPANSPSA